LYQQFAFLKSLHPVGRLDCDTSGLLLFSRDGQLTQSILDPKSGVKRIYEAIVAGCVVEEELRTKLQAGVQTSEGIFPAQLLYSQVFSNEQVK
jgi:23S rRNA pseudouridine2605 synthase